MTIPYENYRVLFTPLERPNVYGQTVDVTKDIDITDFIRANGLQSIRQQIDDGDYDFGIFTFGDITLSGININHTFNDQNDALSIFPFSRDLCKVEVRLYDPDGNYRTRFRGIIDEQATREDIQNDRVRFKVLSLDSLLKRTEIAGGAIAQGDLFSIAINKILNVPEITNILNYDALNINLDIDLVIDDGEFFSSKTAKVALDEILIAANSILIIDKNENIIVKPRTEGTKVFELFGRGDKYGRENIVKISEVNDGKQRAFSSILINDIEILNPAWIKEYGYKQKSISFDFLTDEDNIKLIGNNLLDSFQVPKPEIQVTALVEDLRDIELLDVVKIDYDYRVAPYDDAPLPMTGQVVTGAFKTARVFGAKRILPNVKWKVIEIDESPSRSEITLKLRKSGKTTSDGYFVGFSSP